LFRALVKRAQLSFVTPAPTLPFVTSVPPTLLLLLRLQLQLPPMPSA
jgi:hypothetical protein